MMKRASLSFILLISLSILHNVHARGGGRGGGGGGGSRGGFSHGIRGGGGGGVGGSGIPSILFYILLSIMICMAICILCVVIVTCCDKEEKGDSIPCYLCETRIDISDWDKHRRDCYEEKKSVVLAMPMPFGDRILCGKCQSPLRLWPSNLGVGFKCDDLNCQKVSTTDIVNTGSNRYNCFLCDFDICEECAERIINEKPLPTTTSNLIEPTNSDIPYPINFSSEAVSEKPPPQSPFSGIELMQPPAYNEAILAENSSK